MVKPCNAKKKKILTNIENTEKWSSPRFIEDQAPSNLTVKLAIALPPRHKVKTRGEKRHTIERASTTNGEIEASRQI